MKSQYKHPLDKTQRNDLEEDENILCNCLTEKSILV